MILMEETAVKKKHTVLRKLITLVIIIAVAWLLGQLVAPVLLKTIFL